MQAPSTKRRASADQSELEWQFDALDLGLVERWLTTEARRTTPVVSGFSIRKDETAQRIVDVYLDTDDWRIGRGGYVLRERHRTRRVETTMKSIVEAKDGFRRRLEVTEPHAIEEVLREGDGPVGWRARSLVGHTELKSVIEVTTRRQPIAIVVDDEQIGELVLDETSIKLPGITRRLHLRRVELEVGEQALEIAGRIVGAMRVACGLAPATLSKFEAGLLAGGLSIPGPPELGPTEIDRSSTIGELALVALRRDTAALLRHEPGTRLGEDSEELHQMRVSTRRLRAALALFEGVLPVRAASMHVEIGWLANVLGAVRDLDVQLERTAEWIADADEADRPYLLELVAHLEGERSSARTVLLEALDSRRYTRLIAGLSSMLRTSSGKGTMPARVAAVVAMPELIELRQRDAKRLARRAKRTENAAEFHRLRIRTKRLRYALEFSGELYGGAGRRYVKLLSTLQSRLGAMQDAEVAAVRLRSLALELPSSEQPLSIAAVFTVGGLAARYRTESSRILGKLADEVDVLGGGAWRRLLALMERERAASIAERVVRPTRRLHVAIVPAVAGGGPVVSNGDAALRGAPAVELVADPVLRPVVPTPLEPLATT